MFIQVIQGKTNDAEGVRRQFDRWEQELAPGAKGYLGSTGGVADDGTVVLMARFESSDAAKANSARAEQGDWWNETSKYFDGEVTFRDCAETDTTLGGGSDDAGFVQVMQGRAKDRKRVLALEEKLMPQLENLRPDVLGSIRGWDGDLYTEAIYFTSEDAARKGEATMAGNTPPEFEELSTLTEDLTFIDLKDPWLRSA